MDTRKTNPQAEESKDFKRWHYQTISPIAVILIGVGAIFLALALISDKLLESAVIHSEALYTIFSYKSLYLIIAGVSVALGVSCELISRFRTPPPTWRVKQELIRTLGQLSLLDINDMARWQGMFAVAPMGKWNRKTKSFVVPFLLRHANANEKTFADIDRAMTGFARSSDVSVEIDNSHRLYNMKLTLWYGDSPYETTVPELNPWR